MMPREPRGCTNALCDYKRCKPEDCNSCHWFFKNVEADQTDIAIGNVKLIKCDDGLYRYRRVNKNGGVV